MLNAAQFSAAKSQAEAKLMQASVFNDKKEIKSFSQFSKDASAITDISQKTWLRVEYETCRRNAVSAQQMTDMRADKDLYPYWTWKGVMDDREREEHVEMEGQTFRIGDPDGDACFPPIDWNCRCVGDSVDGQELQEKDLHVNSAAESNKILNSTVDEQFRFCPADQGAMPNDKHSYFDIMPDANAGNAQLFRLESAAEIADQAILPNISEVSEDGIPLQPQGNNISTAFSNIAEPLKPVADHVMDIISQVHGIDEIKAIPIMQGTGTDFDGAYNHLTMGKALDIEVNKNALNKEFTLLHEIGHFIDDKGFGAYFETEGEEHGAMAGVLKAMKNSDAVKALEKIDKSGMMADSRGKMRKLDKAQKEVIKYYLNPQEQWARAYSQYITEKTGDPLLLKQLNYRRKMDNMGCQWLDNDFKKVTFEIDKMFIKKGWAIPK